MPEGGCVLAIKSKFYLLPMPDNYIFPPEGAIETFYGFIVHSYTDLKRNRLYMLGRLEDGRSFAAIEETWRPYFHISENDRSRAMPLLRAFKIEEINALDSFSGGNKLLCLKFFNYSDRTRAASILEEAHIQSPDADIKPADLFLIEKQIRGSVQIKGCAQKGKRVDIVIRNPDICEPRQPVTSPLRIASIDIETDVETSVIRAISIAWTDTLSNIIIDNKINGKVRVVVREYCEGNDGWRMEDEKSLLRSFIEDIRAIDPDVLTGWSFIDFDFPRLADRFQKLNLPFTLGRSADSAKFFPGDDDGSWRRRSASAVVPGRQVIDALRVMRAGMKDRAVGQGFSLEEIAQQVLGEGKIINETGDEKIAVLDRLYSEDPKQFGEYCLRDAQLVLKILAKTGLFRLTMERAQLTGVTLDKAWTSVVSFERVYGM